MGLRVGNELKFKSPYILGEVINAYFDQCDEDGLPYTLTGLCLATGLTKATLLRYARTGPHVSVINQARLIIQHQLEMRLLGPGRATGAIFALKQFGWSDRGTQELEKRAALDITSGNKKWTVEVVAPGEALAEPENSDNSKKGRSKGEVPDSTKVTPLFRKKAAF